ncbi:MAG: glycine--tRNA ligase [Candidatus Micrarchaeaceae archaeon]
MDADELLGYAKKLGFFWPTAEIYGGISGIFDYGHLGAQLKRNFENLWLNFFVYSNPNYYLIEGSTILPEKPLIASGHASRFNDILVGCKKCNTYYRADILLNDLGIKVSEGADVGELSKAIHENNVRCPKCGGELAEPKAFNMMVDVHLGPDKGEKGYLRPETAQLAYLDFFREFSILRKRLPIGLAIIGRAYRNEISPRQGLYRMRELTQAELQIFFMPEWEINDAMLEREMNVVLYMKEQQSITGTRLIKEFNMPSFYVYHMCLIDKFYKEVIGIPAEKLRFYEKGGNDKAFYNKIHMDIEVNVESWGGFREVGGLHYRGEYDLTSHTNGSGQDLSVDIDGKKAMPNVLEVSFGVDRNVWMLIDAFYAPGERAVLKLKASLSPYKVAVFPLQKDSKLVEAAQLVYSKLKGKFRAFYDESGSIGKRYARMDEIGTPYCITIDFDTIGNDPDKRNTVTIRNRDTREQERVPIEGIEGIIESNLERI